MEFEELKKSLIIILRGMGDIYEVTFECFPLGIGFNSPLVVSRIADGHKFASVSFLLCEQAK
jgi:hypothetical protein